MFFRKKSDLISLETWSISNGMNSTHAHHEWRRYYNCVLKFVPLL